jgi:hypothetical protein
VFFVFPDPLKAKTDRSMHSQRLEKLLSCSCARRLRDAAHVASARDLQHKRRQRARARQRTRPKRTRTCRDGCPPAGPSGYDHVDDHDDGALLVDDVNLYNGADGYDHDDDHDDGALQLDDDDP